jgi:hypothetical protein
MLTVDDYGAIRRAHRDGMPIKQIVGVFGHSRNTIRKVLRQSEPNPVPQIRNRRVQTVWLKGCDIHAASGSWVGVLLRI